MDLLYVSKYMEKRKDSPLVHGLTSLHTSFQIRVT